MPTLFNAYYRKRKSIKYLTVGNTEFNILKRDVQLGTNPKLFRVQQILHFSVKVIFKDC